MQLSGNSVLITGGSSGIGLALAEAFLAAGSEVAVCARNEKRLREAAARHPALRWRVCDVSQTSDRRALLEWASAELPGLNVLINNAGIQRDIDFSSGIDEFLAGDNELRVNLEAPIALCGLFMPLLRCPVRAAIINVSSGLGFMPIAAVPVYCASKAGLHAFTLTLRQQLACTRISVHEVVPPAVDTHLNPEGRARRGHFTARLEPRDFVAAVMRGLRDDASEIGYGVTEGFVRARRLTQRAGNS